MGQINSKVAFNEQVRNIVSNTVTDQAANCGLNSNSQNIITIKGPIESSGFASVNIGQEQVTKFDFSCMQDQKTLVEMKNTIKDKINQVAKQKAEGWSPNVAVNQTFDSNKQTENIMGSLDMSAVANCVSSINSKNVTEIESSLRATGFSSINVKQKMADTVNVKCVQNQTAFNQQINDLGTILDQSSDQSITGLLTSQSLGSTCSCLFIVAASLIFSLVMAETGGPKGGGGGGGSGFGGGSGDGGSGGGMSGSIVSIILILLLCFVSSSSLRSGKK